ncbi:MAG: hypothetical protein AB7P21_28790 [Lautropia sp.]
MHASIAAAPVRAGPGAGARSLGDARAYWRLIAYVSALLASLGWTLYAGKDLPWDAVNHHLYQGFSAAHDRFERDFAAVGFQAYFNPYPELPFYRMVMAGWPSAAIACTLALVHALNPILSYELALVVGQGSGPRRAQAIALAAMASCMLDPVFLQVLGTSYADATTATLALAGLLACAHATARNSQALLLLGGVLAGLATGLKLSNFVVAVGVAVLAAAIDGSPVARIRRLAVTAAGGVLGFGAAAGWWGWQLWRHHGNPFFPLLNQWFASPDFTTEVLVHRRFVPQSLLEFAVRPFEMALPRSGVHVEGIAPDARFALLLTLAAVTGIVALSRAARDASPDRRRRFRIRLPIATGDRIFVALGLALAVAWVLWLTGSGNSRYFIPMRMVASVLLLGFIARASWLHGPSLAIAFAVLLGAQAVQSGAAVDARLAGRSWDGPWYPVSVPEPLSRTPYLYIVADVQAPGFLLPFLAPGSGMVNIGGFNAIAPASPGGDRVAGMIDRRAAALRVLVGVRRAPLHALRADGVFADIDRRIGRFGLRVDDGDCETIDFRRGADAAAAAPAAGAGDAGAPGVSLEASRYLACRAIAGAVGAAAAGIAPAALERAFDRIEDACPRVFQPRRSVTVPTGASWSRLYANTDVRLWATGDRIVHQDVFRGGALHDAGRIADWQTGAPAIECRIDPPRAQPAAPGAR